MIPFSEKALRMSLAKATAPGDPAGKGGAAPGVPADWQELSRNNLPEPPPERQGGEP